MSYSRWGPSVWYTIWRVMPEGVEDTIDNQIFWVVSEMDFTYRELKDNLEANLAILRAHIEGHWNSDVTDENMAEVKEYMLEFIEDVERKFGK